MQHDSHAWLILAHAYVRVSEIDNLLERFGDAEGIVRQNLSALEATGLAREKCAAIVSPDQARIAAAREWLDHDAHHVVTHGSENYPELLSQIPGAPLLLYVNGDVDALHLPALAIVGSRNPTQGGSRNATDFARHLARQGFTIVSGLAQGIDTAAHSGALDGDGTTVAVLGNGIDRVYPASNRALAHSIAQRGALVSE